MSNCCASVGFVFWEGSPSRAHVCVCVCVSVRVCAHWPVCSLEGRGGACECVELAWASRAGKQLQSKAHPGAPVVTGVWATPAVKGGERFMLIALPREWLESRMLISLLF